MTVFTGEQIPVFQAIILKGALKLWIVARIKANRAYTPTRMLEAAGRIVGKKFKRGQHEEALKELELWIITKQNEEAGA